LKNKFILNFKNLDDHNRVKLNEIIKKEGENEADDYINASFIVRNCLNTYIKVKIY
jgi:protein tyrosine phosphatase